MGGASAKEDSAGEGGLLGSWGRCTCSRGVSIESKGVSGWCLDIRCFLL